MKPNSFLNRFLLLFFIVCLSCNKTDTGSNKKYTPEYVTAIVSGRVTDDANRPVSGALIKVGSASTSTDVDGGFIINDVTIDKKAALIKVEKDGFYLGTKTIVAIANKNNQAAIKLIRKILAGNISGSGGGTITVPSNGGAIAFEANSVVDPATGNAYTGTVAVHAFINPEADDFNEIMPGTLRGITTTNEETGLQSFGMMAVELSGSAGEKLQIAPGKTASLRFPIPSSLQAEAPATIPLWSLDETTGLWKQEGSATREGTEYVGNVSHFSFWNCDAPFPVLDFTGIVKNEEDVVVAGAEVVIVIPPGGSTAGSVSANGFTTAEGVVTGKLPANKALQLKVYDKCHSLLLTKNIGPFTTTANLGTITVNSSPAQVTFSGTVKNCFNEPVSNGFVTVRLDGKYFNIPVTNGNFSSALMRCSNSSTTATITAFDANKQEMGTGVNIEVSGSTVNAGTLTACGVIADTYIKYTLDGVSYENLPPDTLRFFYSVTTNKIITYIEGKRPGQQWEDIVIMFSGPQSPGIHPVVISDVYHGNYNALYFRIATIDADITEYGNAGGYVSGTFSGNLSDSLQTKTVPISCSFRVKRE